MKNKFNLQPRALVIAVSAACGLAYAPAALAQAGSAAVQGAARAWNLPAGPLGATLMQIAQASGQPMVVDPELVRGLQAPAIQGSLSPTEAVQRAIGGTDLQALRTENGTLTLRRKDAGAAAAPGAVLPAVTVTGGEPPQAPTEGSDTYTVRRSSSATRLDLSPRETPQTLSVTTRAKMDDFKLNTINDVLASTSLMDDFKLNTINDVLASTAGITAEKAETDRTYFTARGFDVTNFTFDGVGVPLTYGAQAGDLDTAMFDRIEVLQGANGLSVSTGNPSATVNFVRKRPTPEFQASAGVTVGSWDTRRIDADISSPFNEAGTLAGRLVVSHQDGDSYLDRYRPNKDLIYGVLEAQLSPTTTATLGYSYQDVDGKGAMWGALPLSNADGSRASYRRSTNTSADWSFYNSKEQRAFAELNQQLGGGWQWKTSLNYDVIDSDSSLFYVAGAYDASTGTGLYGFPSATVTSNKRAFIDSNVVGKYELFGRAHDLAVGLSYSRSRQSATSRNTASDGAGYYFDIPVSQAFGGAFPSPTYDGDVTYQAYTDTRKTVYASTRLHLNDRTKLLLGVNYTQADSTGYAETTAHVLDQSSTSPYVGLVFDLNQNLSAFGSYTKIFNPQYQIDVNRATLAAAKGDSYELGLKGEFFERRLNASASVFRAHQKGLANYAGMLPSGAYYYDAIDAKSEGVEFNLHGQLADNWQVGAGLVVMHIDDEDGNAVRTYVPRRQLRASTTYRIPRFEQLKIGANVQVQSKVSYDSTEATTQGGYAVVGLMARYDFSKNWSATVNLNNVFDRKYLYSVSQGSGYYAAPRNGSVTLNWKY